MLPPQPAKTTCWAKALPFASTTAIAVAMPSLIVRADMDASLGQCFRAGASRRPSLTQCAYESPHVVFVVIDGRRHAQRAAPHHHVDPGLAQALGDRVGRPPRVAERHDPGPF